jgi:LmbE family N-acetylglucosaminyl deacetylase
MTSSEHVAPGERIVVVSPHLDDGVLSLGAVMASWAKGGAQVELLTVLACDPESDTSAGGWDRRGGFSTEGDAARARREEDQRACAIVGVSPVWLPFGSVDYDRHGDEHAVLESIAPRIGDADLVVLPGFPLSHPDHAWLMRAIARGGILRGQIAYYAEQPYSARIESEPRLPDWLASEASASDSFKSVAARPLHRFEKWRAIRQYRSQLPLLAIRGVRSGAYVHAWRRESVASLI